MTEQINNIRADGLLSLLSEGHSLTKTQAKFIRKMVLKIASKKIDSNKLLNYLYPDGNFSKLQKESWEKEVALANADQDVFFAAHSHEEYKEKDKYPFLEIDRPQFHSSILSEDFLKVVIGATGEAFADITGDL